MEENYSLSSNFLARLSCEEVGETAVHVGVDIVPNKLGHKYDHKLRPVLLPFVKECSCLSLGVTTFTHHFAKCCTCQ